MNACWDIFAEYASSCSIHGVKYLAEPKRPIWERICWIIAFIVSIYFCGSFIMTIYNKWDRIPVVVSFDEKSTPVWKIPFPGVTICPQTKYGAQNINFTDIYHKLNDGGSPTNLDEMQMMESILQTCDFEGVILDSNNITFGNKFIEKECIHIMNKMYEMPLMQCLWKTVNVPCHKILTDIGVCYTFNMITAEEIFRKTEIQNDYEYSETVNESIDWSVEQGYGEELPFETYPKRVLTANKKDSLDIVLGLFENDTDYLCTGPIQGYKIAFHSPSDIPRFIKNYHYVLLDKQVYFSLIPIMMTTTKTLKSYSPIKRQCFFNNEKYLRYFQVYSQSNCELECLTNYTLYKCGCVKFSMPSAQGIPLCGTLSIKCMLDAEYDLSVKQQEQFLKPKANFDKKIDCNCLPECISIDYETETTNLEINWNKLLQSKLLLNDTQMEILKGFGFKLSHIKIFFKDVEFISIKRSELYGISDFIANFGGLLGLFMGFSLLSTFEIFYFWTIRVISNYRMRRKNRKFIRES